MRIRTGLVSGMGVVTAAGLLAAAATSGVTVAVPMPGGQVHSGAADPSDEWWRW